ncbi:MAG: GrpB family protein [Candidatus Saccharibacteria bacterium]|nr:GrpB family protein [Candidatus Saccharibacteria bacterium]
MGLKVGEVKLEKHNPRWHQMFARELDELWDYFGDTAIRISHIGSTAIDGLEAKPIIDIAVAVNDLDDFNEVSHKFTSDPNYSIKEDFDNDEILIRKGGKLNREFYIHVMDIDSKRYKDTIFFRDTLLHDEKICNDYRNLKHILARKYPDNRKKYTASKSDFINNTLDMCWAKTTLIPIVVICAVGLATALLALWARLSCTENMRFFYVNVLNLSRIGLCFGGIVFLTTALATIVLCSRYFKAKKEYDKIVIKINKELAKEAHKK